MADHLGMSKRQVDRYLDPKWLTERGLEHLQYSPPSDRGYTSAPQQEASDRCKHGDHSWMSGLESGRFKDYVIVEEVPEQNPDDPMPMTRTTRRCWFCGYEESLRDWAIF